MNQMNQMNQVCISLRQKGTAIFRQLVRKACVQSQCAHVEFKSNYENEEGVRDANKIIEECELFVGIYGDTYGKRFIKMPDSKKDTQVSPIELELRLAIDHFEKKDIKLYILEGNIDDPDLLMLYNEYISKCNYEFFKDYKDLELRLNTDIKDWYSKNANNQREFDAKNNLISIDVKCKDKEGLLTSIFRVLSNPSEYDPNEDASHAKYNVSHAKQVVYRNTADITILANLVQQDLPKNKTKDISPEMLAVIETNIRTELDKKDKGLGSSAMINIGDIKAYAREVTEKGHYAVEFFDNPGIAALFFNVFSDKKICILESNLDHFPSSPQVGRFFIIADLTGINRETTRSLVPTIEKIPNVIHVEGKIEMGTWWY
ncbi:MAG: DUF4062 domain-containing protein [Deltaproteobacteria bacterium]|nr:DUF4062 domain-containing protein [Deltaproteobacteria bacterium]